jgi:hypothetical protein
VYHVLYSYRLWGRPPSLLSSKYRGLLPRWETSQGVKLTTHFHLLPRLRMHGAVPSLAKYVFMRSRDSSVVWCWATGWMIGGLSPGRSWEFFSSLPRPDRLWTLPSFLSNGCQGLFPRGLKLTTHLRLVPRSRMHGAIPPLTQYAFMA